MRKTGWLAASLTLGVTAAGCTDINDAADDTAATQGAALALTNGLALVNGLALTNGLAATNGLANTNGLALTNGLAATNGLAPNYGLMTQSMGRRTVAYIAACALSSGQSLVKADQYGKNYTFTGRLGLAPAWLSGGLSAAEEQLVSACVMAHLNTAGMHVPIWLAAGAPNIGWGQSSSFPAQEAAYFGNIMRAASDGNVHAWYCDGRNYQNGIVPGRIGADQVNAPYRNPWGAGQLCDNHCTKYGSDGYTACNGVSNPITVWRQSSYNPVFDDNYVYKLTNAKTRMALDVSGGYTGENGALIQYPDNGGANQHFRIIQVASSQWKIFNIVSSKTLNNRYGAGANVMINSYNGTTSDIWAIDDHNGHFIIRNKASNAYLRSQDTTAGSTIVTTTSYSGAADTDWDLTVVDSL